MDKSVAEYIALQQEPFKSKLEEIRAVIYAIVPEATEAVSYGVPCFKYLYYLVGFGVTKKYCSLYLMSNAVAKILQEEGIEFLGTKTTAHFSPYEPLPLALIERVVRERVKENEGEGEAVEESLMYVHLQFFCYSASHYSKKIAGMGRAKPCTLII
jgi:uncharacterized protein YdhG (YjbR/CyaY superfamily)